MINTTSFVHLLGSSYFGPGVEFDTFKDGPKRRRKGKLWLYGQSKLVGRWAHPRRYDGDVTSLSPPLARQMSSLPKNWSEGMEIRSFRLQSTQVFGTSLSHPGIIVISPLGSVDTELVRDAWFSFKWPLAVRDISLGTGGRDITSSLLESSGIETCTRCNYAALGWHRGGHRGTQRSGMQKFDP